MPSKTKPRRPTRSTAAKPARARTAAAKSATRKHTAGKRGPARNVAKRHQPETLRLRSIFPTYTVDDLTKSIAWYCDGLGFIIKDRWEDKGKLVGVMLGAGTCELGLSQDDFSKGRNRDKGIGYRLHASTIQSVDELADRLRAFGGKITAEPAVHWGERNFTAEDPDGYKITIGQSKG